MTPVHLIVAAVIGFMLMTSAITDSSVDDVLLQLNYDAKIQFQNLDDDVQHLVKLQLQTIPLKDVPFLFFSSSGVVGIEDSTKEISIHDENEGINRRKFISSIPASSHNTYGITILLRCT